MQQFGPFAVGIALFAFLAIAAVAGIVADYKKRQIVLEPLRAAIERGQPLDPGLVERLMAPEPREEDTLNPLYLKVGGIITIAAGVGIAMLGYFIGLVEAIAFYPVLGLGLVAVCVGVGLMIAAGVVERHAHGSNKSGTAGA
jgi:Domain of unknown function (DUF6249)